LELGLPALHIGDLKKHVAEIECQPWILTFSTIVIARRLK